MTFKKRNPLAALWLNDRFGGWSLAEVVGTTTLIMGAFVGVFGLITLLTN